MHHVCFFEKIKMIYITRRCFPSHKMCKRKETPQIFTLLHQLVTKNTIQKIKN